MRPIYCVSTIVLALSLLISLTGSTAAQEATPADDGVNVGGVTILPPDASYAGVTRGEWHARHWQWSSSFPAAVVPSFEPTGERCGLGQSGPVFFMPTTFTDDPDNQNCLVPEGTAIFIPAFGAECSTVEPPPFFGRNEEELRACASAGADALVGLEATINGEEVPDLLSYRSASPLFSLNFPTNNAWGIPAGVAHSVSEGYSVIIAPPAPGEYEISVTLEFEEVPAPIVLSARVIVEAPQVIEPAATPAASPAA